MREQEVTEKRQVHQISVLKSHHKNNTFIKRTLHYSTECIGHFPLKVGMVKKGLYTEMVKWKHSVKYTKAINVTKIVNNICGPTDQQKQACQVGKIPNNNIRGQAKNRHDIGLVK